MSTLQVAPVETRSGDPERQVINDFSIQVATVNGSGSQTANNVLMRSIFQMGIPVSGKNMFPSNIAGLPTWFTIRASKDGFIGRKKENDFLIYAERPVGINLRWFKDRGKAGSAWDMVKGAARDLANWGFQQLADQLLNQSQTDQGLKSKNKIKR